MIPESILSNCYLILISGFSIYSLRKCSYEKYKSFLPRFLVASIGIASIGIRSSFTLIYKLFFKVYTINPLLIEEEERENKLKINIIDEILRITSSTCITCSLYYHHKLYITGSFIVLILCFADICWVTQTIVLQECQNWILDYCLRYDYIFPKESKEIISLSWFSTIVFVTLWKNDNYSLLANFPYTLTNFALPPEGFYQGWTLERSINDYMMMIYIILVTESLRS